MAQARLLRPRVPRLQAAGLGDNWNLTSSTISDASIWTGSSRNGRFDVTGEADATTATSRYSAPEQICPDRSFYTELFYSDARTPSDPLSHARPPREPAF